VIAATNRPDVLDPALLRPGRFDRNVVVDNPDVTGRDEILRIHARNKPISTDVDWKVVAKQTPGFSGADLANLINESALLAARENSTTITHTHLEDATLRVIAGPERSASIMTEHEREIVAHHEMGHALVGLVLPNADPVHKVSIVSRGRALGLTMQLPDRDRVLGNRHEYTDKLAGLLGGRVAEEIMYGEDCVTSGAADDIQRASQIARGMVTELGMSPLGPRHFPQVEPGEPRAFSEKTAELIDLEIDRLLHEAMDRARHVLRERRDVLVALAQRLLEVETMQADELQTIVDGFGKRQAPVSAKVTPIRKHDDQSNDQPMDSGRFDYLVPSAAKPPQPAGRGRAWRRSVAAFSRFFGGVPADS
jgi:cell division protease FtsH